MSKEHQRAFVLLRRLLGGQHASDAAKHGWCHEPVRCADHFSGSATAGSAATVLSALFVADWRKALRRDISSCVVVVEKGMTSFG